MFFEIEGIDGAGKTTQCGLLEEFLRSRGLDILVVREPAGTEFGKKLKDLIMSDVPRSDVAELFSFLAAKAQLYRQTIIPALAAGRHVIADRGNMSFLSYHHLATGISIAELQKLMELATREYLPEATIVLDVPASVAMARIKHRGATSPFDKRGVEYYEAQRVAFRSLCDAIPSISIIDGTLSRENVHAQIRQKLLP